MLSIAFCHEEEIRVCDI